MKLDKPCRMCFYERKQEKYFNKTPRKCFKINYVCYCACTAFFLSVWHTTPHFKQKGNRQPIQQEPLWKLSKKTFSSHTFPIICSSSACTSGNCSNTHLDFLFISLFQYKKCYPTEIDHFLKYEPKQVPLPAKRKNPNNMYYVSINLIS